MDNNTLQPTQPVASDQPVVTPPVPSGGTPAPVADVTEPTTEPTTDEVPAPADTPTPAPTV